MEIVLADMVSIGLMGFISDRIIVFIEKRTLVWRKLQSH
jgi:NitT/TauT family transport system permease protein